MTANARSYFFFIIYMLHLSDSHKSISISWKDVRLLCLFGVQRPRTTAPSLGTEENRGRSFANDLNSPLHTTRVYLRSAGSNSKYIRGISRGSYALKGGRDRVREKIGRVLLRRRLIWRIKQLPKTRDVPELHLRRKRLNLLAPSVFPA